MPDAIGIDIGSSFIKAARIDLDRLELRRTCRAPFPEFLGGLPPLYCEADPAAVLAAVEDVLALLGEGERGCEGLVLCGQMHGFVLVNPHGEAVSNYISWLDQRVSRTEFDALCALVTEADRAALGYEFRPSIALPLLWWLGRRGALPAGATPVSIADFVAARLCGEPPVMDPTQAAAFGALRLDALDWHAEVIGKVGLDGLRWPPVRPSGAVVGKWRGAPCHASVGDQQCALAGALLGADELSVNIGTGSQVAMLAAAPASPGHQVRPYFDGAWLGTITHIPGGRALSALIGLLTELGGGAEADAWRYIERAVERTPATDLRAGVAFFPGACGERGFLENLHEGNLGVGHVFRAVFESMAANYATCARRLDNARAAERLVLLREHTAAALGLPYRLSPHPEDTLFGLMVLALAFGSRHDGPRTTAEAAAMLARRSA